MTKIKKKLLDILLFDAVAGKYLENHKSNENKICTSIKNIARKQIAPILQAHNEAIEDLKDDNCATDPVTKVILRDSNGNRQFTPDGSKKMRKAVRELLHQEHELDQRITAENNELINTLSEEEKIAFSEFVIDKQPEEAE